MTDTMQSDAILAVEEASEADEMIQCAICMTIMGADAVYCESCGQPMTPETSLEVEAPDSITTDEAVEAAESPAQDEVINDDAPYRNASAPRDALLRKVSFRAEATDGLTLEGYAAVFDDPAMIDSWEGTFRERIMPGAFTKTISERSPVLMFDHGQHPMVGSIPIGTITALREDSHGLYVKAKLNDNWLVEPVRDAIRGGSIDGMSIRMSVIKDDWSVGQDHVASRTINEVALAELGPVVFPAYENTNVSVRSREVLTALTDPEVRGEIARAFASGTDLASAADSSEDEPTPGHSPRSKNQRKAIALRSLSRKES